MKWRVRSFDRWLICWSYIRLKTNIEINIKLNIILSIMFGSARPYTTISHLTYWELLWLHRWRMPHSKWPGRPRVVRHLHRVVGYTGNKKYWIMTEIPITVFSLIIVPSLIEALPWINAIFFILGRELGPSGVSPYQNSRWKLAFSPLKHV